MQIAVCVNVENIGLPVFDTADVSYQRKTASEVRNITVQMREDPNY